MSPERHEDDDFLEDEEQEEYGQRSIFATGWFRAVLVLLVLAVIAVIAVPLIGGWFEPTPPSKVTSPLPPPVQTPAPTPSAPPSAPKVETPPPAATPTPPSTPPQAQAPTPTTPPAPTAPTTPPPSVNAPVPRPETPAPSMPSTSPSPAPSAPSTKSAEKATPRTKATDRTASVPAKSGGNYWVQVGAFKESRNAEGLAQTLRSEGFPVQVATVTRDAPMHVVRIGGYPDRAKASAARQELQGKGHSGFVTQGPAK